LALNKSNSFSFACRTMYAGNNYVVDAAHMVTFVTPENKNVDSKLLYLVPSNNLEWNCIGNDLIWHSDGMKVTKNKPLHAYKLTAVSVIKFASPVITQAQWVFLMHPKT